MSHYWAANEDARLRAAIARDWLEDLAEFDSEHVSEACREWRRAESKRPTIADIRKRCIHFRDEERRHRRAPPPVISPEEYEQRAARAREWARKEEARYAEAFAWRQKFAEERGFPDFAAVIEYGIVAAAKLKPIAERGAPAAPAEEIKP